MSEPSPPSSQSNETGDDAAPTVTDSGTESDVDPDTMTKRFIELQTRLYKIDPDFDTACSRDPRITKGKSQTNQIRRSHPPQVSKLLCKVERLKADILFDRYDAERQWKEKRIQLAQTAARRRKLQLDDSNQSGTNSSSKQGVDCTTADPLRESSNDSGDDGGAEALGEFLSGLDDAGIPGSDVKGAQRESLTVRDFGKWSGISPRRVLEEACKAR